MKWIIGQGKVSFWKDIWWGDDKLINLVSNDVQQDCSVKTALKNNDWQQGVNGLTSDDLLGIQCMVGVINQEEDKCVSIATSDGQFLIKSPWGL